MPDLTPLTPEELARLEELRAAATPGPWVRYHDHDEDGAEVVCHAPWSPDYLGQIVVRPAPTDEMSQGNVAHDNAAYIAAFDPETTGRLLAQVAAAEQEVAAWRGLVKELRTDLAEGGDQPRAHGRLNFLLLRDGLDAALADPLAGGAS